MVPEFCCEDLGQNISKMLSSMKFDIELFTGKNNFIIRQSTIKDLTVQQGLLKRVAGKKADHKGLKLGRVAGKNGKNNSFKLGS